MVPSRAGLRSGGSVVLAVALLLAVAVCSMAATPNTLTRAPVNPQFLDYPHKLMTGEVATQTPSGHALGYVPGPVYLPHLKGQPSSDRPRLLAPPPSYDLRTLGKLTAVRDQGQCGSCWAFATYGSLESWLLTGETWDFSEQNLKNTHGFDWTHCYGGNAYVSTAYLARWSGPVDESDDPYDINNSSSPADLPVQKHVQDVIFLPDRSGSLDNDAIKQAVMTYGAVYTTLWMDCYCNDTYDAYYCPYVLGANHAVCIVGWDDNFDKNKFLSVPAGDGAFIMRNSWGTSIGDAGYLYVSYYDANIGYDENRVFLNAEDTAPGSICHDYDPLGWVTSWGYGSTTAWFANIFTADSDQVVTGAATYAASPSSTYDLYVYLDPTSDPVTGATLLASKSGVIAEVGYHTMHLDTGAFIPAGHTFSVVVTLTTPGYNWPIPSEYPLAGYSSAASANPGEGFISGNGVGWSDMNTVSTDESVCLKAFAQAPDIQVLLEVHPNERGQGPPTTSLKTGGPYWTWPVPSGTGAYTWKKYTFGGSSSLWIQVCGQAYSASQNLANNGFANGDVLKMVIDGVTPTDVWGIQSGPAGKAQWQGGVDQGKRLELEFMLTGLTPGAHSLGLSASMCPSIYWVKVYDLEPRYIP